MRKILLLSIPLIIFFAACSNEESNNTNQLAKNQSNGHFYGIKTVEQPRGVAQIKKLWYPGTTIDIKFLNGSQEFQQKVKTYAAEWEQYADITFNFIETGDADVRITFDSNNSRYVTWSTIGTDCKIITNQSDPTMNFVDWNYLYEEEIKGDVLRAFGQVLGLELEHRHIDFDAGWRDNISLYWEGSIEDIPWDELKKYVFDPLESSKVLQTDEYDEESIMIWPFPRQFALNTARDYNFELSEKDKEFISSVYPKVNEDEPIFISKCKGYSIDVTINNNPGIIVDWGDGNITKLPVSEHPEGAFIDIHHEYSNEDDYFLVKIYGNKDDLVELMFATDHLSDVDISRLDKLEFLALSGKLDYVDLRGNVNLVTFDCSYNDIITLDLSGNILLNRLYCQGNLLTSLDVSANINLNHIRCGENPFVSNRDSFVNFALTLPTRSNDETGNISESSISDESKSWVTDILETKNWKFSWY